MLYMATCTINIPQMLAYIPYMDPMGKHVPCTLRILSFLLMDVPSKDPTIQKSDVSASTSTKLSGDKVVKVSKVSYLASKFREFPTCFP